MEKMEDPKNKEMFTPSMQLVNQSWVPGMVKNAIVDKKLTPEQRQISAEMMTAASKAIHAIYGASLTGGERSNAAQWAPMADDSYGARMAKLKAAQEWGKQQIELPPRQASIEAVPSNTPIQGQSAGSTVVRASVLPKAVAEANNVPANLSSRISQDEWDMMTPDQRKRMRGGK
jgi:hypothetical protein